MKFSAERPFDFEVEFEHAMFAVGYHGDGLGAELIVGWRNLIKHLEALTLGDGADVKDVESFRSTIYDPENWGWSYATPSQPYHYGELRFEADSIVVYRVVPRAIIY